MKTIELKETVLELIEDIRNEINAKDFDNAVGSVQELGELWASFKTTEDGDDYCDVLDEVATDNFPFENSFDEFVFETHNDDFTFEGKFDNDKLQKWGKVD